MIKDTGADLWIIWWIKLDNPIDLRNIKTTSSNISAQKNCFFGIAEMEECFCSLVLLLLALSIINQII